MNRKQGTENYRIYKKKGDITHTKVTIRFPGMANMKLIKMYKIDS